ncbi:hypothetical protein CRM22_002894 [Opisthorchis felineus]|uniref:Uncharacterized protein n=1 Tax=Opisthorchis felineus TaxID=147828 RepID=A0A4S2MA35_OPIFE|nr:hypothetical protein CRM22_002894 [Opisthorchis felineus]
MVHSHVFIIRRSRWFLYSRVNVLSILHLLSLVDVVSFLEATLINGPGTSAVLLVLLFLTLFLVLHNFFLQFLFNCFGAQNDFLSDSELTETHFYVLIPWFQPKFYLTSKKRQSSTQAEIFLGPKQC